ncbi:MAG TPA: hypothetical protein VM242_15250 [Acidimicrobiales bacterium]|nr:hypothetical protein [Acidimicrobiales bacterium]
MQAGELRRSPGSQDLTGKEIWPGAKQVWRALDWSFDVVTMADERSPAPGRRPLLIEVMHGGRRTPSGRVTLTEANRHFEQEWAGLPAPLKHLSAPAAHPVNISAGLRRLAESLDAKRGSMEAP